MEALEVAAGYGGSISAAKAQGKVLQKEGTAGANGRRGQGEPRGSEGTRCDLSGQVCHGRGVYFRACHLGMGRMAGPSISASEGFPSGPKCLRPLCRHFSRRVSELEAPPYLRGQQSQVSSP